MSGEALELPIHNATIVIKAAPRVREVAAASS